MDFFTAVIVAIVGFAIYYVISGSNSRRNSLPRPPPPPYSSSSQQQQQQQPRQQQISRRRPPAHGLTSRHSMNESGSHLVTDDMVRTVLTLFPQLDAAVVRADLARTGNVEETIDNALSGLLPTEMPPRNNAVSSSSMSSSSSSSSLRATTTTTTTTPVAIAPECSWEQMIRNINLKSKRQKMINDAKPLFIKKQSGQASADAGLRPA